MTGKQRVFTRWEVTYTAEELTDLIKRRTGVDFGLVEDLVPLERGTSGRIFRLKITGTKQTLIIGKDLLIRKALSNLPLVTPRLSFPLSGILVFYTEQGWGHGVGLCQIGGAVMAAKGYAYKDILQHYYRAPE